MNFRLIIVRDATVSSCPKCGTVGSLDRRKSKNRFESIFARIIRRKSYHCRECKWDGKLFAYRISRNWKSIVVNYIFLIIALLIILTALIILSKSIGSP
ncbi:MAG: hypothetical protein PHN88_14465 [Ignavibacteria bacterium]|nr:hypothetical protein [Ignavibacteria bacterium]